MPTATVLVTGVSGFIAKHCAVDLLNHGYRVRGTVRSLAKSGAVRDTIAKHADPALLEFAEADLMSDKGWAEAMNGVDGVLHVASPFIIAEPKHPDDLIKPAVDGTLRVLAAAHAAGVKRFVHTSSTVAVAYGHPHARTAPFTEDDWTDVTSPVVSTYGKSKTLAERAARDYVAQKQPPFHYCSINPGLVCGPALDADIGASADLIRQFLAGKYPGAPRLAMPVVDVRDVATMHRLGLETSEPSGGRYLGVSETAWFIDIARVLRDKLGDKARRVPRFELPDLMVKLVGLVDKQARATAPDLGRSLAVDTSRTRQALGIRFRPMSESVPAMGESLIALGLV